MDNVSSRGKLMENLQAASERRQSKRASLSVGLAHSPSEILDAQRLRYRVFAGEMGANLPSRTPGGSAAKLASGEAPSTAGSPVLLPPVPDHAALGGKSVLIADDVADSGETLKMVKTICQDYAQDVRCAVIYEKPRSIVTCEYVWRRTDRWVSFPWSSEPPVVSTGYDHPKD